MGKITMDVRSIAPPLDNEDWRDAMGKFLSPFHGDEVSDLTFKLGIIH